MSSSINYRVVNPLAHLRLSATPYRMTQKYRHYKTGDEYVIQIKGVIDTTTGKKCVVYSNAAGQYFVRPEDEFFGTVTTTLLRFQEIVE